MFTVEWSRKKELYLNYRYQVLQALITSVINWYTSVEEYCTLRKIQQMINFF